MPHRGARLGRLSTVNHWEEEHHGVEISLENDLVTNVQTRVRRFRVK